jgi:uncharacterized protein YndB with AHSA1/START domain
MPDKTRTPDGVLEPTGDQWQLRFTRHLAHPPERVWRVVTEPEHLRAWFPQQIVGEWEVGARLVFKSEGADDFEGEVLAVDPPRLLEFTWGTDTLRFEVAAEGEARSVLTVLATFDEVGKAARDAAGWHECLDNLEVELSGQQPTWAAGEPWREVHPAYVDKFGPQAATIGPPKGAP